MSSIRQFSKVVLLISTLIISFLVGFNIDLGNPTSPQEQVIRYRLEISNDSYEPVKDANVRVFAPVKAIGWQRTLDISSNHDFTLVSDSYGNQVLDFSIDEVGPFSKEYITVTAVISFDSKNMEGNFEFKGHQFLENEKYIDKNNLKISMLASTLSKTSISDSIPDKARETHSWVSKNMTYSGYQKNDLGAAYAIKNLRGDCTEYMYLNSAIMRAQGIPNIPVAGFHIARSNGMLSVANYHNWNYFDSGKGWVLSDSQGNNFDENYSDYVVFRIIAKDEIQSLSNTHRFSISDDRLKVKLI